MMWVTCAGKHALTIRSSLGNVHPALRATSIFGQNARPSKNSTSSLLDVAQDAKTCDVRSSPDPGQTDFLF